MGQANAAPGEQSGKTGQGKQPAEDNRTLGRQVDVRERAEGKNEDNTPQRAARSIDVGEELGRIALLGEGREGTRAAVDCRHADGDDGDQDDDVHERVESDEACVLANQHERRCVRIRVRLILGANEAGVVVRNQQADEEKTQDVEERDTPKDLLDGAGKRLDRVVGFSGSETNELRSAEGKCRGHEDGAEALEAVLEGTGVVPELGARVVVVSAALGATAEDEHEGNDHEDDGCRELEAGRPELLFGIAQRSEDVDDYDEDEEYGDPNGC